jgi:diaminopimelate epimerase
VHLTKHHGLGNDFLVLLGGEATPAMARALCDRRTGIGADGLLWGAPATDGADATMVLFNADGSRAEMSGNGIRCLAQAVAAGRDADLRIATDAGLRLVEVRQDGPGRIQARVDMGAITGLPNRGADAAELDLGAKELVGVSVGNPHLVALFVDVAGMDAAADGFARIDRNVEFVVVGPGDGLRMRVVERGVGETQACGTGACAAAWAAHGWGLVGDRVTVRMPGGDAEVELGETVHLTGPAVHVADIEAAWPS